MTQERDDYSVDCPADGDGAVLRGVLRLASVDAYDRAFIAIRERVGRGGPFTMDLSGVPFMNSSGIRAVASLVLLAKERGTRLRLVGSAGVPWQRKTIGSLQALDREMEVELR